MAQKFANAARGLLASGISNVSTTIEITEGGSLFPVANGTDWFKCVLQDEAGIEIVTVTGHTSGSNTFTVTRGQEGTTARSFALGSVFGQRVTAGDMEAAVVGDVTLTGTQTLTNKTINTPNNNITTGLPALLPTLNLDFANVKALDPRITFTRASEGRFYDGRTFAKAEENLLLQSQTFENASWGKTGSTITTNSTTAPDGTVTAETLAANASTGFHNVQQDSVSITGTQRVLSCFIKAGTHSFAQLCFAGDVQAFANFNVTTGAVGTVGSAATASIVDAGNGWYRCIITTSSATASAVVFIVIVSSATAARFESWTTAGTEAVFLWGAQLEQRSSVTAYTPTTTAPITRYQPVLQTAAANVARFDHSPLTGESLGLLVEEQRSNLLLRSAEFDNASWVKSSATVSANALVAPEGTLAGDKVFWANGIGVLTATLLQDVTASATTAYTISLYAKAAELSTYRLGFIARDAGSVYIGEVNYIFDLTAGTSTASSTGGTLPTSASASIVNVGNGWYRCSITATTPASTGIIRMTVRNNTTGDGFSGIFIWGAQLEAGPVATSYIPTVASQVTRQADAASMTGVNFSSWYRQDEGTIYAEASAPTVTVAASPCVFSIDDNTTSNRIQLRKNGAGAAASSIVVVGGTIQYLDASVPAWTGAMARMAMVYKTNDFITAVNSSLNTNDTSGTVPVVTQLQIGFGPGTGQLNGTIRRLAFYPTRCTTAQIQALTS